MRPAIYAMTLFFLLQFIANTAQGIRFDAQLGSFHSIIHEKESLMAGGSDSSRAAVLCKDDGFCSGKSRKLMTKTMATSKSEGSDEKELGTRETHNHPSKEVSNDLENFDVNPPASKHKQLPPETYPDLVDIGGMDYSPARRKPPIHN